MLIHFTDISGATTWTQHQKITLDIPPEKDFGVFVVTVTGDFQRIINREEALRLLAILNQIDSCCEDHIPEM